MRILSEKEVCALVGTGRTSIRRWERAGQFPKRLNIGPKKVGWPESEIQAWIASRNRGFGQGAAAYVGREA